MAAMTSCGNTIIGPVYIYFFKFLRELQQQRRRRLRKRHLKNEFALLQIFIFIALISTRSICQMLAKFSGIKDCIQVREKGKVNRCLVFMSSTKREIRHFHVVVLQRRQRNVQKSVMHGQIKLLF